MSQFVVGKRPIKGFEWKRGPDNLMSDILGKGDWDKIEEQNVGLWFCFSSLYHNCWCLQYYHLSFTGIHPPIGYFIDTSSIHWPIHSHSYPSVLSTVVSTLDMDIRDVGSIPTGHIFFSELHRLWAQRHCVISKVLCCLGYDKPLSKHGGLLDCGSASLGFIITAGFYHIITCHLQAVTHQLGIS